LSEQNAIAPVGAYSYYHGFSEGYERALRAAMEAGTIRPMNPEAIPYAFMGIGHFDFVALRWLVWPQQGGESPESTAGVPDVIFASVMGFISHRLTQPIPSVSADGS
jgi:hypothetical protein